jgi:hypothetical protein
MARPLDKIIEDMLKTAAELECYDRAAIIFAPILELSHTYMMHYASGVDSYEEAQFAQRMDRAVKEVRNACISAVAGIAASMIVWPAVWARVAGIARTGVQVVQPVAAAGQAGRLAWIARFVGASSVGNQSVVLRAGWSGASNWLAVKGIQAGVGMVLVNPVAGAIANNIGVFGKDVKVRGMFVGEFGLVFLKDEISQKFQEKLQGWKIDQSNARPFMGRTKQEIIAQNDMLEKKMWWLAVEHAAGGADALRKIISDPRKNVVGDPQGTLGEKKYLDARALRDIVMRQFWTDIYGAMNPVRYDIEVSARISAGRMSAIMQEFANAELQFAAPR